MNHQQEVWHLTGTYKFIVQPHEAIPTIKRRDSRLGKFDNPTSTARYKKKDRNKARKDRR